MLTTLFHQTITKWLFILVIISEVTIYFLCLQELTTEVSPYQLMARYSARVSFAIFVILYGYVAWKGLKQIIQHQNNKNLLIGLLFVFAFNHLIHFCFLAYSYSVQPYELNPIKHGGGAIAYITLSILPLWLAQVQQWNQNHYYSLHIALFFIWIFFNQAYMGRYFYGLEWGSSPWLYGILFMITIFLLGGNIGRIWQEKANK